MHAFTLIIIARNEHDEADFEVIAQKAAEQAPDIRPVAIRAWPRKLLPGDLWSRPALTVAFRNSFDTGDYPAHFRVETLLGEALCCRTIFSSVKRPPLEASDKTLLDGQVASNAVVKGSNHTAPARMMRSSPLPGRWIGRFRIVLSRAAMS